MSTLLEAMDLDTEKTMDIIGNLVPDFPHIANAMHAMLALNTNASADDLYDESLDMRRSHLSALFAVIDGVREQLTDLLASIAVGVLPEDEPLAHAQKALDVAGEALQQIVETLYIKRS